MKKTLWIMLVIAALAVAVIVATPTGIDRYAEGWLRDQGVPEPTIGNVDFNLFTGVLRIESFSFSGPDSERGHFESVEVNVELTKLLRRRLLLQDIKIEEGEVDVRLREDGSFAFGGLVLPLTATEEQETIAEAQSEEGSWGLGLGNVIIEDVEFNLRDELLDTQLDLHRLTLDQLATWEPNNTSELKAEYQLNGGKFKVQIEASPFAPEPSLSSTVEIDRLLLDAYSAVLETIDIDDPQGSLSLDISTSFHTDRDGAIHIEIEGTVEVDDIAATMPTAIIRNDRFAWTGNVSVTVPGDPNIGPAVSGTNDLVVEGLAIQDRDKPLRLMSLEDLAIEGALSLDLATAVHSDQDGTIHMEIEGTAEVDDVAATVPTAIIRNDRFAWTGNISVTVPGDPNIGLAVSGTNDLVVEGLAIQHHDKPLSLLSLEELIIEDANISSVDQIQVSDITMNSFQLLRSDDADNAALDIGNSTLQNIELLNQSQVVIERAIFDSVVAYIERQQDGKIKRVAATISDFTQPPADSPGESPKSKPEVAEGDATPFKFLIGQLDIGGDSRIRYRDTAVTPAHSSQTEIKSFRLVEFGNVHPEQSAQLSVELQQDDTATFVAEADFRLFDEQPAGDMTISVKRFDLTRISPYTPGYHIQRGRLSLDSHAELSGDVLDAQNSVLLESLKLADKAAGDSAVLGEGLAMPLDVALDLLRDGDDRIKLELPVSGSLKDPKFGTGDIIRLATQTALQKAALSYVKNALQPLGTILFVAKIAGQAARPRFEPVLFGPGDAEVTEQSRAYLDKIAKLLSDRPNLNITFCGVSAVEDLSYFIAQMPPVPETEVVPETETEAKETVELPTFETERLELAQARGTAVKNYLTGEHAVVVERLFSCRPTIEAKGDDGPRVEITL